jgi:hypothetical protein
MSTVLWAEPWQLFPPSYRSILWAMFPPRKYSGDAEGIGTMISQCKSAVVQRISDKCGLRCGPNLQAAQTRSGTSKPLRQLGNLSGELKNCFEPPC